MISLFIDTCTNHLILGIYKNKTQVYLKDEETKGDLSSKVLSYLKDALAELALDVNDIDNIFVVNGPGSFTGIRVGVTIAKTLAWSLNKNIYTLSELQLQSSTNTDKKYNISMIDARRGYVYAGMYDKDLNVVIEDQYIELDRFKELIGSKYPLDEVAFISYDQMDNVITPNVDIEKLLNNVKVENINPHSVNPNYLKKTEAEEKLNDKNN